MVSSIAVTVKGRKSLELTADVFCSKINQDGLVLRATAGEMRKNCYCLGCTCCIAFF